MATIWIRLDTSAKSSAKAAEQANALLDWVGSSEDATAEIFGGNTWSAAVDVPRSPSGQALHLELAPHWEDTAQALAREFDAITDDIETARRKAQSLMRRLEPFVNAVNVIAAEMVGADGDKPDYAWPAGEFLEAIEYWYGDSAEDANLADAETAKREMLHEFGLLSRQHERAEADKALKP